MRNLIRTMLGGAAATIALIGVSSPASAAIELCYVTGNTQPQCASTTVNVLVDQVSGNPVSAGDNDNTTNVTYNFTSSTDTTLVQNASGQANVESADGVLNQITFNILNGAASLITFNLLPLGPQATAPDAQSVVVNFVGGSTVISGLSPNGQNFYGIRATAGEQLTSLAFGTFLPAGSGIQALQQVQLNLTPVRAPVPEPATWAMMLIGFGGIGFTMRRRRSSTAIAQLA